MPKGKDEIKEVVEESEKKLTLTERIWNLMRYSAKQHIIMDLADNEKNEIADMSEEEAERTKERNRQQRLKDGFPAKLTINKDVDRIEVLHQLEIERALRGSGSQEDINAGYRALGEVLARVYVEYGREYERVRARFGDNVKYADAKAAIITGRSQFKGSHLDALLTSIKQNLTSDIAADRNLGDEVAAEGMIEFEKALNETAANMNPEDKALYEKGFRAKNERDMGVAENAELKKYSEPNGPAEKLAQAHEYENNLRAYKELGAELTPSVMADVTSFDTKYVDLDFIKGVLRDMESTGAGKQDKSWYESMWHRGNSTKYEDMLKDIKKFVECVELGETGKKIYYYQNKMIESVKAYLSGKELVRDHAFGQKRIDDAIRLMANVLPYQEFERDIIAPINAARRAAGDYDHWLNAEELSLERKNQDSDKSEYLRLRLLGLEGTDEIQRSTQEFVTEMPENFKQKKIVDSVQAILAPVPKLTTKARYLCDTGSNDYTKLLVPINDGFKAIGPHQLENRLADNDFVALAYLGTRGPLEYFGIDRKPEKVNEKAITLQFEEGRQKAAEALRKYEAGDKKPLVSLIVEGIKHLSEGYQNQPGLSDTLMTKKEMMMRAYKILERDPELMKMVRDKKTGLSEKDISDMRALIRGATVVMRGHEAREKLAGYRNGDIELSKEDLTRYTVNLEVYTLMNKNMEDRYYDSRNMTPVSESTFMKRPHNQVNLGEALGSFDKLQELRKNVKEIVVKNKMTKFSGHDWELHEKDDKTLEKRMSDIGKKMPSVAKPIPSVKKNINKNAEKNKNNKVVIHN